MIKPTVIAQLIAVRMRASYGFMFKLLHTTSLGETPTVLVAILYGM